MGRGGRRVEGGGERAAGGDTVEGEWWAATRETVGQERQRRNDDET
jgi:hypothetical protein